MALNGVGGPRGPQGTSGVDGVATTAAAKPAAGNSGRISDDRAVELARLAGGDMKEFQALVIVESNPRITLAEARAIAGSTKAQTEADLYFGSAGMERAVRTA